MFAEKEGVGFHANNLLVTNAIARWFLVQCPLCNQFYSATGTTCQLGRKYTFFSHECWLYHNYFSITGFKSYLIQCDFFFLNMAHLSNSLDEQVGQNTQLVASESKSKKPWSVQVHLLYTVYARLPSLLNADNKTPQFLTQALWFFHNDNDPPQPQKISQ